MKETYKSVVAIAQGGPEMLKVVENELRPPAEGEARIKVLAAPVVQDDVEVRRGNRPWLPKFPFTPGYAILGLVDAVGAGVSRVHVEDRVAALTNFGGYAEYIYWDAQQLVHVPYSLDPAEAIILILNYLVPMQAMHSVVKVKPGEVALVIGASGGTGTAFLDLGRQAGLNMYGIASKAKHPILVHFGAEPIDYRTQDFVEVLREREPGGIDYVFNGMAEEYFDRSMKVLRRGGVLVHYGGPRTMGGFYRLVAKLILYNLLPNGKRIKGFGTHTGDIKKYESDWLALFGMLERGEIEPVVAAKFPLLQARQANEALERGEVTGTQVLLDPELL
jgi:NADPH:quinone reductase-like Zn-dependent oxidoreductase